MEDKIVLVTGGFDPLHIGHIEYFKEASKLGNKLVVGLNSDEWLKRKKGKEFMDWINRASVISELKSVDYVIAFDDSDNSAVDAIKKCLERYPNSLVVFANGGDRGKDNSPELSFKSDRLEHVFGVGGTDKKNSSSWILNKWQSKP